MTPALRQKIALSLIRQYPDEVLKMRANPVSDYDETLQGLVRQMKRLMCDAGGIGLAATQIGILMRLFVFQMGEEVVAIANPEIAAQSEETEVAEEGCLSLLGIRAEVERPVTVTITGQNEHGAEVRYCLEGIPARCAQHEIDHLDGVLIIDHGATSQMPL